MDALPWAALLLLGAWHGINPGMGWLFAVALGMQEGRGRAVWRALPPLAVGHAVAVLQAVIVGALLGVVLPREALTWIVAALLAGFGVFKLVRASHPRFGGMKASWMDLAVWSMLMATAHGAGLMVVPFALEPAMAMGHGAHAGHAMADTSAAGVGALSAGGVGATLVHTAGYIGVTGVIALVVYQWAGLRHLRRFWLNLDVVWAVALIGTAVFTVMR
jgi:hypothetical protein